MKLKSNCPICDKELKLKSETQIGASPETASVYRTYTCGHSFVESATTAPAGPAGITSDFDFTSVSGTKAAWDYQKEGIEFIFNTDFNCMVADPMGLGKTIQILLAARNAKLSDGTPRFKTILAVVKSATQYQWFAETKEWLDSGLWSAFLIKGTKSWIPPGARLYVLSMDTMSRFMKTPAGLTKLKELNVDLVIVDECHSFKDPDSARTQALVAFLQDIGNTEIERDITLTCNLCRNQKAQPETLPVIWDGKPWSGQWIEKAKIKLNLRQNSGNVSYRHNSTCPICKSRIAVYQDRIVLNESERTKGLVMLSGTPIKNRADEYFVSLNLLRPDIFTSLRGFQKNWLTQDANTGKYNRIAPWKLEQFRQLTSKFIIRREKNQVLSLPPFRRAFENIVIEDENLKVQYNKALDELQDTVDRKANLTYFDVSDNLMTLRRITGMGKIPYAVDYILTFLESTEDEKIAIGVHHEAVRDGIYFALKAQGVKVLKLSGEDNPEQKNRIQHQFCDILENRVLIVNMLAGGVGLNLQACNNTLILERQWNAADEEQFESRFNRAGQKLPVLANYMLAEGTIDGYFSALVEQKRRICGESLDGWDFTSDSHAIRNLVEQTISTKLK